MLARPPEREQSGISPISPQRFSRLRRFAPRSAPRTRRSPNSTLLASRAYLYGSGLPGPHHCRQEQWH